MKQIDPETLGVHPFRHTEVYRIHDNDFLPDLTISKTVLYPSKQTRGHSHDDKDEIYFFTKGFGWIKIGDTVHAAYAGNIFLIEAGEFHQVGNGSLWEEFEFTCVFKGKR